MRPCDCGCRCCASWWFLVFGFLAGAMALCEMTSIEPCLELADIMGTFTLAPYHYYIGLVLLGLTMVIGMQWCCLWTCCHDRKCWTCIFFWVVLFGLAWAANAIIGALSYFEIADISDAEDELFGLVDNCELSAAAMFQLLSAFILAVATVFGCFCWLCGCCCCEPYRYSIKYHICGHHRMKGQAFAL